MVLQIPAAQGTEVWRSPTGGSGPSPDAHFPHRKFPESEPLPKVCRTCHMVLAQEGGVVGPMDPRTQMFLYQLLWGMDVRLPATFRSFGETFEEWARRRHLPRTVEELEHRQLMETATSPASGRLVRLARSGVIAALGGRDPEEQYARVWDHVWRGMIFDIPVNRGALRARILRRLRAAHFGCLQGSLWITPDPLPVIRANLGIEDLDPRALLVAELRPLGGETDASLVSTAWSFRRINLLYGRYLRHIERGPPRGEALRHWRTRENHLWLEAMKADPLLPRILHPRGYLGPAAYESRRRLLLSR